MSKLSAEQANREIAKRLRCQGEWLLHRARTAAREAGYFSKAIQKILEHEDLDYNMLAYELRRMHNWDPGLADLLVKHFEMMASLQGLLPEE